MTNKQRDRSDISSLLEIMRRLRDPDGGCPWDLEQDFSSIAPYTIEEAYEVADAIDRSALDELSAELGDLLLQVVFHAQMAAEIGAFDFGDVVDGICSKMIRRHPHVFADEHIETARAQTKAWDRMKREERGRGVLDDVPVALPGLTRAVKLGRRAAGVGFDWPEIAGVRAKVDEELAELDEAIAQQDRDAIEAEMGDLLFALANLCRHLELDPEGSVRGANQRFERRFAAVEAAVDADGREWSHYDLEALEAMWQAAKSRQLD